MVKTENNSDQHNALKKENKTQEGAKDKDGQDKSDEEKKKLFDKIVEICGILCGNGYMEVFTDTRERIQNKFMRIEDELIKHDLDGEGKIEDMNPDHNVIEK